MESREPERTSLAGGAEERSLLAAEERSPLAALPFEDLLASLSTRLIDVTPDRTREVLSESLAAVARALEADRAAILEHDPTDGAMRFTSEWAAPGVRSVGASGPYHLASFPWAAAELTAGRPMLLRVPEDVPPGSTERDLMLADGPGSLAIAPLRIGEALLGVVAFDWRRASREWTPLVRSRLRMVGELYASALHRLELEAVASDRLRFERLLSSVSTALIGPRAADGGIAEALRALAEDQDVDRAWIYELDASGATWQLTEEHARPGVAPTREDARVIAGDRYPWTWRELSEGRALVVRSPASLPPEAAPERLTLERSGVRSMIVLPLRVGERTIGIVGFDLLREARDWSGMVARLQLVGEIFSTAIDRRRSERALEERQRFDALLARVSADLLDASIDRLDDGITRALARLVEGMSLLRALVLRFDDAHTSFTLTHAAGRPGAFEIGETYEIGLLRPGLDVMLAESMVIGRVDALPPGPTREAWARLGVGAVAALALRHGDRVVGAVGLHAASDRAFEGGFRARIRLVHDILSQAIARRDAEIARLEAFEELARLKSRAEIERDYLREEIRLDHDVRGMIAESPALRAILETIEAVAATTATVLVRGETGVGKELIARAIHARSPRHDAPLVKVDCASIPRELFESEFFGHVRGAVPGADRDRPGRFELADGGTLFLDEIGEIPAELQPMLLRALQEGEVQRVGDARARRFDVRVIAATNRDLESDVAAGRFRRDLYYRLSVFPMDVPPLRERPEDVIALARHFLRRAAKQLGRPELELTPAHERALLELSWPGNVRELAHVIERAAIVSTAPPLRLELALPRRTTDRPRRSVPPPAAAPAPAEEAIRTEAEIRALERANLVAALEATRFRVAGRGGAAERLGMSPSTLRDRMRSHGIEPPRRR